MQGSWTGQIEFASILKDKYTNIIDRWIWNRDLAVGDHRIENPIKRAFYEMETIGGAVSKKTVTPNQLLILWALRVIQK